MSGEGESQVIAQFTDNSSFATSASRTTSHDAHDIRNKYLCSLILGGFIEITKTKDPVSNILSKILHSGNLALLPENRLPDLKTKCLNKGNS